MWDADEVKRYEEWFLAPQGAFALAQEQRLLSHLIAPWPRRGQRLLEVGCGPGFFLESFWDSGFDVTGVDSAPAMLDAAAKRLGNRADFQFGHADHLPYDDNAFDFVALVTVLEFVKDPVAVLSEARRVARKGLVLGFLNKSSLYYLTHGLKLPFVPDNTLRRIPWFSYPALHGLILEVIGPMPCAAGSVLLGPKGAWSERQPWKFLNSLILPPLGGAFGAVAIDLVGQRPLTPLYLKTQAGVRG